MQGVRPHHRAQCGQGFPHQCGSVGFATHLAFARRGFDGGETLRARLDYADEGGTRQAPPAHPLRYGPPTCYLDFEAMMPPIPLYAGTRPYQTIPFQWSLHVLADDGTLHHREFLADADGDPRHAFAETLIDALSGSDTPIIVYSSYEQTRLNELAATFPDLRDPLVSITGRLADLLPAVRSAVYLPDAGFSNSIKSEQAAEEPAIESQACLAASP